MTAYRDLESGATRGIAALSNEALGTFFLTLALLQGLPQPLGALIASGVVALFLSIGGEDGQFNPALTVQRMVSKRVSVATGLQTIAAQTVGATLAAVIAGSLTSIGVEGAGGLKSAVVELLFTFFLILTHEYSSMPFDRAIAYFSGLSAFKHQLGANSAVVLGVVLANIILGNGLDFGAAAAWGAASPLVLGLAYPFFFEPLFTALNALRFFNASELLGTFLFGLMSYSTLASGAEGAALAMAAALYSVHNIFSSPLVKGDTLTFNPAITIAHLVQSRKFDTWADPTIDIAFQTLGATLAAMLGSWLGTGSSAPEASELGPPAILETAFAVALGLIYLTGGPRSFNTLALGYFACMQSFASSFNPALVLGAYLAGVAGLGDATSLPLTSLLIPILGGGVAAVVGREMSSTSNSSEALGTFFLFLTAAANPVNTNTGALAIGSMVAALSAVFSSGTFNPTVTAALSLVNSAASLKHFGVTFAFQLGGALAAALVANFASAVSDGVTGSLVGPMEMPSGLLAETVLVVVLVAISKAPSVNYGLAYYAVLTVVASTSNGSLANPALSLASWLGDGLLNGGFNGSLLGTDALVAIGLRVIVPLLLAIAARVLLQVKVPLDKVGLEIGEVVVSFLLVLSYAGIADASTISAPLAFGVILVMSQRITGDKLHGIPALSAYFMLGTNFDIWGFGKKLAAQLIGAIAALFLASYIFSSNGVADAVNGGVVETLRNGSALSLLLGWCYDKSDTQWVIILAYFSAASLFAANINSAAILGNAVMTLDMDAMLSSDLWVAICAPLIGAVVAGRAVPLLS